MAEDSLGFSFTLQLPCCVCVGHRRSAMGISTLLQSMLLLSLALLLGALGPLPAAAKSCEC